MKVSLIDLSLNDYSQSLLDDYIMDSSEVFFFNFNTEKNVSLGFNYSLFLTKEQLHTVEKINFLGSEKVKIYYVKPVDELYIQNLNSKNIDFFDITTVLKNNGLTDEDIEITSDILLMATYLVLNNTNIENIVFQGYDLPDKPEGLKENVSKDLIAISKLASLNIEMFAIGCKYFNNFFTSLNNKNKNSKEDDVYFLEENGLNYVSDLCKKMTLKITEKKCFSTLTSQGYEWGTIALCQSLHRFHSEPIIILYSDDLDIELIRNNINQKSYFFKVPILQASDAKKTADRYSNTLNKFIFLGLEPLERIIYIDSDMIILNPITDYLETKVDLYCSYTYEHSISRPKLAVSIISFKPSLKALDNMISFVVTDKSYSGIGDHGYFIKLYENSCTYSDVESNLSQTFFANTGVSVPKYARGVHYHGFKPWDRVVGRGAYLAGSEVHSLWYSQLSNKSLIDFISWSKKRDSIREAGNILSRYVKSFELSTNNIL